MSGESADLMGATENVQRIMRTATVWFSVAVGASAVSTGSLFASGWRPALLPVGLAALWWAGAALVALGPA